MNNSQKPTDLNTLANPEELPTLSPAASQGESLEGPSRSLDIPSHSPIKRLIGLGLLAVSLIAGIFLAIHTASVNQKQAAVNASLVGQSARLKPQTIPLNALGLKPMSAAQQTSGTLTVNGQVDVTNSLVLSPTPAPSSAVAGQLFFNQQTNQLGYYSGSGFIYLQGGSGAVTNNITNVTNITNVAGSSGATGITAINGTAGSIAMFTGSGGLTESMLSQTGSSLTTGSGVENVTLGSTSGTSATVLQGGSGNVAINTGAVAGTSGTVTIESGASSTTAAGNVTVDTGASIVNGTVIADKTFESGIDYTCDPYNGYGGQFFAQSSADAHSGTYSLAMTVPTAGEAWIIQDCEPFITPAVAGHSYLMSAWVKAGNVGDGIKIYDYFSSNNLQSQTGFTEIAAVTDTSTGWTHVTGTVVAPPGSNYQQLQIIGNYTGTSNQVHYLDDITLTDLTASSAVAQLNLGAANAQQVTLGNTAEIGPTDIYSGGSGMNLNSGVGSINLSGGDVAVSSSGPATIAAAGISSFTTSSGSLTLESGGGAGGGVIVKPMVADSTTAFQVQTAAGAYLLNADTTNGVVTSAANFIVNTPSSCNYTTYTSDIAGLTPSAYWKLEDTGTTAADSSGNNDTGTLSNVTTGITPGPIACANTHPAMSFNAASSSNIATATTATGPNTYTQIAMFKTSSANGTLLGYTNGGGNHDRELGISNTGQLFARIYNTTDEFVYSPQTVNDGVWHIAVATVSASGMYLYLDGALVASNTSYNTPQSYSGYWLLGGGWGVSGAPFTGDMGEVAVLPTALTAQQAGSLAAVAGFYTSNLAALGIGTTTPAANLDDAGTALFHDVNNSLAAFQIQNNSGVSLFTADTKNYALIVGNDGAPTAFTIRGGAASGANTAGANLTVQGSNGTGSANGGDLIFQTAQAAMGGIGLDTASQGYSNSTPVTIPLTIGAHNDRVLIVDSISSPTSVTFDGIALTKMGSIQSGSHDGAGVNESMWYLLNPPVGSFNVVANIGGGSVGAMSFYNVDPATPFGAFASTMGQAIGTQTVSLPVTTTNASQVVVDGFSDDFDTAGPACGTTNAGQTILWSVYQAYIDTACGSDKIGAAGGTTMSYQTANDDWAFVGVPLNPSVPGSTPFTSPTSTTADTMSDRLHITSMGSVGIDNANPQHTLDVVGDARIQSAYDTTTAFQVQDTNGLSLLTVDTADSQVNLGKGMGSSLGNTSVGPNTGGGSGPDMMTAQKVTTTSGNTVTSLSVYLDGDGMAAPNNQYQLAIYSDNAGQPGNYIASSAISTLTNTAGWYSLPVSATLAASTTYWLVYWQDCSSSCGSNNSYRYSSGVSGAVNDGVSYTWQSGPDNGFPATFPTPTASYSGTDASLYATFASGGPALTLNATGTLTQSGAALFQDPTNSSTAFQIQNSLGTPVLVADTAGMLVTVTNLTVTATLTVDGHIVTGGNTPAIAAGTAACTTPTLSVNGTDTAGTITITTGSGCSVSGTLATLTFASAFAAAPHITLTPGGSTALSLGAYVDDATISTTGFTLGTNTTPTSATTYQWNYQVIQ